MERKPFKNLSEEERQNLKQNIFQRLGLSDEEKEPASFSRKTAWMIAVAASILVIAGVLVFRASQKPPNGMILLASSEAGQVKQVMLEDSSIVILNPVSSLYAIKNGLAAREVYLEGNGFFKVKHLSSNARFVVHANNVKVTVLGTEFNVNARTPETEVALTTGRVRVENDGMTSHAALLSPGEMVTASGNSFKRSTIDIAMYSAWSKGEWNFKNTSLGEIAKLVEKYYSVQVVFQDKNKKALRMTAVMPVNGLPALIQVIRETLSIDVTLENQQLYIQ